MLIIGYNCWGPTPLHSTSPIIAVSLKRQQQSNYAITHIEAHSYRLESNTLIDQRCQATFEQPCILSHFAHPQRARNGNRAGHDSDVLAELTEARSDGSFAELGDVNQTMVRSAQKN